MGDSTARDLFDQFRNQGWPRIEEAINSHESETGYLDFKCNGRPEAPESVISDKARTQFAKILSAFANTDGGVIVWGVLAEERKPRKRVPIPNARLFIESLNNAATTLTNPPVIGVEHSEPIPDPDDPSRSYVVTLVPSSPVKPHMNLTSGAYQWRSGSNSTYMPNDYVRALFLARAQPDLEIRLDKPSIRPLGLQEYRHPSFGTNASVRIPFYQAKIGIFIRNKGEAVAHDASIAFQMLSRLFSVHSLAGLNTNLHSDQLGLYSDMEGFGPSRDVAVVEMNGRKLYPGFTMPIAEVRFDFHARETKMVGDQMMVSGDIDFAATMFSDNYTKRQMITIPEHMFVIPSDIMPK